MSSIRRVQTERLLQDVVHSLYSEGTQPTFGEIAVRIARYFSQYPAGNPLPLPTEDALADGVSSAEEYNRFLGHLAVNLDVLYETSLRQVEDVVTLTSALQTYLSRLQKKRSRVEGRINDYLLGLSNTDGYFYSVSDNFVDIDFTDLTHTSAEVDTNAGVVVLPTLSSTTTSLPPEYVSLNSVDVTVNGDNIPFDELAPFSGALEDTLDNIVWAFEVETDSPEEVVATVNISVGREDPVEVSRVDFKPYGATPVQVFLHTRGDNDEEWEDFGGKIQTGTSKMIFSNEARQVQNIRITLRKREHDYTENVNNKLKYKYIFGARDLSLLYQTYESNARFVSLPLIMPTDDPGLVVDAVSIDVDVDVPTDTEAHYYVAASDPFTDLDDISDVSWREIVPIGSNQSGSKIVNFHGASQHTKMIREDAFAGDLELLPIVESGPVADRNPTPSIIEGVDIYKIANLDDEKPLLNSLSLHEGVNTTRIYSRNIDSSTPFREIDLEYWANVFNEEDPTVDYGRIDAGNEFFYGGDVGANAKDIFVETYLDMDRTMETFLAEFQKIDIRSRTWDVKVFFNGRILGHLPSGTHSMQLPWRFREGLNHVVLLIRIPADAAETHQYMGALSLMGDRQPLHNFGLVRLDRWRYVDIFEMRYNESGQPKTFTIHDNHIISRRKPTTNFQFVYATDTQIGPDAVRLRVDMGRFRNNPNVTPKMNSYRLRFSYAGGG